ncbi:MAG: hypothetical protein ACREBG_13850 [Pyrinomonadaceae bacterium]
MTNHPRCLRPSVFGVMVVAAVTLITVFAGTVASQSGRRLPRSTPVAAPSPETTPVEKKPPEETKPALSFIVGSERHGNPFQIPSYFFDSVVQACADRLDDSPSVKVDIAHRDMNRGEAIKRAKAEKETYVVLLDLRLESMRSGNDADLRDIYVEYWVFAPTTAKLATSGHAYQQGYRKGPVVVAPGIPGRTNVAYTEQLLKQAAREVAERILAAMRDRMPEGRVPG